MIESFKKRLIKLLAISLGIILVLTVVVIFLNRDINKRVKSINQSKQALIIRDQQLGTLSTTTSQIERANEAFVVLESMLPMRDDLISFPGYIASTATDLELTHTFAFGTEEKSNGNEAGSIQFRLSVTGTLPRATEFLKKIEEHPYIIRLGDLDIQQIDGETFQITVPGVIYTQ